ncbi:CDK-activating kinase assembly factor MAT1 isoform X2 [Aix galericulata]|nr:CDK-activating kinase assembly factor MAT1 isoform X2 [Aix galericulata]
MVMLLQYEQRCESCVELLFVRGAGNCHECDTPLRKSNFRVQLFEDPAVDKEVEIRKKVLKIYNKREDDFPSLSEYNDFLEEIEEIVFNLTNNVDLENTKKKMELYQKDNKEVIQKNKIKLTREQEELEEALEVERQENEQRRLLVQKEEQLQQMIKRKNKQALLDELESSSLPASLLLAQHKDRSTQLEMQLEKPKPVKPVTFSTGIKMDYRSLLVLVVLCWSSSDKFWVIAAKRMGSVCAVTFGLAGRCRTGLAGRHPDKATAVGLLLSPREAAPVLKAGWFSELDQRC